MIIKYSTSTKNILTIFQPQPCLVKGRRRVLGEFLKSFHQDSICSPVLPCKITKDINYQKHLEMNHFKIRFKAFIKMKVGAGRHSGAVFGKAVGEGGR